MNYLLFFVIKLIIVNLFIHIKLSDEYRFELDIDVVDKCQNNTCGAKNQFPHTMCIKEISTNCTNFQMIQMRRPIIQSLLMGHNGIRNKFAYEWELSSENLLHWSKELSEMAHHFLFKCSLQRDECDYLVYRNLTVGQNLIFLKGNPGVRWPEKTIRNWYSEIGSEIRTFAQFKKANPEKIHQFTQMIWPKTEFVGCAAATMFDGVLAVCYYHPTVKLRDWLALRRGIPCSDCIEYRATCSLLFNSLCGVDISLPVDVPSMSSEFRSGYWNLNFLCIFLLMVINVVWLLCC